MKQKVMDFYEKHYRKLMLISIAIFVLCIAVIAVHHIKTGEFIEKGITLKGGSLVTVQLNTPVDVDAIQNELRKITPEDITVKEFSSSAGAQLGIIIETTSQDATFIKDFLNKNHDVKTINIETIGPSLGESFFKQAIISVIIAFILMALVVLIYFRLLVPSGYIVLCALGDILFPWAMLLLLNVKLSTAGVAALLMLIGYSVDTDILLTTRVIKRQGTTTEKIFGAFSTGVIMTLAAMAATGIAYLTTPSEVLKQIMMILFFGLVADLWNTWFLNTALLKSYVDRKKEQQNG